MKPFQEFLRDQVAPVLKAAGYRCRGAQFRHARDDGHRAVFSLRQWRLGQRELEFHVEESLLVRPWLDFLAWSDPDGGPAWTTAWENSDPAAGEHAPLGARGARHGARRPRATRRGRSDAGVHPGLVRTRRPGGLGGGLVGREFPWHTYDASTTSA